MIASASLLWACGDQPGSSGPDVGDAGVADADTDGATDAGPDGTVDPKACSSLFDQDIVPEWRVELSDSEWAALEDEFLNRVERDAAGLDIKPYHPVESITYDDGITSVQLPNVLIRLKGQSSWIQTITYDDNPKMQFVIAFNEINKDGRFKGVRKVELDMPRTDWTFLRQRLALHILRDVGQDAQCANNARLYINGEYYGLFTHLERLDKEFLQRIYGKENNVDDGDLWKAGTEIRTNEDNYSPARLDALWAASTADEIAELADLDAALYEWSAEAIMPHADGYHIGRPNYHLYDHPERGFLWLPSDLDTAFDYYPHRLDPMFPFCERRDYWHWIPYATTLADPEWSQRYVQTLAEVRGKYDPAAYRDLVDQWSAQIAADAEADWHRSFTMDDHQWALDQLRDHLFLRAQFIDDWISCRGDGQGEDFDSDGAVFCFDCDDLDDTVGPDQTEICNGVDDDCDGFVDEGLSCS